MDFLTHALLPADLRGEPGFLLRQADAARGAALFAAHGLVFALHLLGSSFGSQFRQRLCESRRLAEFPRRSRVLCGEGFCAHAGNRGFGPDTRRLEGTLGLQTLNPVWVRVGTWGHLMVIIVEVKGRSQTDRAV